MNHKREVRESVLSRRLRAFPKIAKELGEEHAITKMMGSLAWGRHPWDGALPLSLQDVIRAASGLDGVFHTLNLWARDNDYLAQRVLLKHYDGGYAPDAATRREEG